MADIKHLTSEELDDVIEKLLDVQGSLCGIGALFKQQTSEPYYESKDVYGLGRLFSSLSEELSEIHTVLRCGKLKSCVK